MNTSFNNIYFNRSNFRVNFYPINNKTRILKLSYYYVCLILFY